MYPKKPEKLLWLDVETTGLNPEVDDILEICVSATNENLKFLWRPETFLPVAKPIEEWTPYCRELHKKNGLVKHREERRLFSKEDVEGKLLLHSIATLGNDSTKKGGTTIAGLNPAFDIAFCRKHFPRFAETFSYRTFDLTTLRKFFGEWPGKPEPRHRADLDVLDEIQEAKYFYAKTQPWYKRLWHRAWS